MSLTPGEKLGRYEILDPLGAGGMGEVYRAKDTRLDRTVAVKILPEHLAESPERKERFEREARTISKLNHPHICTLFDVSEHDGVDFLVMECIEGETLASRLARGPLPFGQVLDYGAQIASGLDRAHRAGIVHRDLKPGNVMLTKDGVKLLDFGLAKVVDAKPPPSDSSTPTEHRDLSGERAILGTPQYMAPEQLQGDPVDARTDVFALGTLLYEMVTGKKAFEGRSGASLAGAILKDDVPAVSPPALDHLIQACVAKDPENRWQSAFDLARQLKWLAGGALETPEPVPGARPNVVVGALLLLVAVLGGLLAWSLTAAPPSPPRLALEFEITLPETDRIFPQGMAFSPDGSTLVYVARRNETVQLFRRDLDRVDPTAIAGTENASWPFFSPDGRWIGFSTDGKLQKVSIAGGAPQTVCATPEGLWGAVWRDDTIFFGTWASGIQRVPASGGEPEPVSFLEEGERAHYWPALLPHRNAVVFTSATDSERWIVLKLLDSEERYRLTRGEMARALPNGDLVIARDASLWRVPFDRADPERVGEAVPVRDGVGWATSIGRIVTIPHFALAEDGTLAYSPGGARAFEEELVEMTREGARLRALDLPGFSSNPAFSPDGSQLAAVVFSSSTGQDVWLYDWRSGRGRRFTTHPARDTTPVWSHDGRSIFFSSNRADSSSMDVFVKAVEGNDEPTLLMQSELFKHVMSASADGRFLVLDIHENLQDLWILPLTGDGSPEPVVATEFDEDDGTISPDGRWFAYSSTESGRYEVYVIPFRRKGQAIRVSLGGAKQPRWRGDGREIFYLSANGALMAAPFDDGRVGSPQPLFDAGVIDPGVGTLDWDVRADGQRFVVSVPSQDSATQRIHVVLDWARRLE